MMSHKEMQTRCTPAEAAWLRSPVTPSTSPAVGRAVAVPPMRGPRGIGARLPSDPVASGRPGSWLRPAAMPSRRPRLGPARSSRARRPWPHSDPSPRPGPRRGPRSAPPTATSPRWRTTSAPPDPPTPHRRRGGARCRPWCCGAPRGDAGIAALPPHGGRRGTRRGAPRRRPEPRRPTERGAPPRPIALPAAVAGRPRAGRSPGARLTPRRTERRPSRATLPGSARRRRCGPRPRHGRRRTPPQGLPPVVAPLGCAPAKLAASMAP
mmetsp:Transcript_43010/g.119664  ORF Transcript_43010/g.119664 Transcript_43010/m.119664 type:complete len:266 (-) Transcript_43010:37-834(-)